MPFGSLNLGLGLGNGRPAPSGGGDDGGGGGASFTYITNAGSAGLSSASYTETALAIGDADADRIVVVGIAAFSSTAGFSITGVTIGGVSAAEAVQHIYSARGMTCGIYYVVLAAGTTADIVVTADAALSSIRLASCRIVGATAAMPFDTSFAEATSSAASATLDLPDHGHVFSIMGDANGVDNTFTGATVLFDVLDSPRRTFGLKYDSETAKTGHTISTVSNVGRASIVAASWGLAA